MTVPEHSASQPTIVDAEPPAPETEPANEQGEQWHGAHSNMQESREPRRQPGGVQRSVDATEPETDPS